MLHTPHGGTFLAYARDTRLFLCRKESQNWDRIDAVKHDRVHSYLDVYLASVAIIRDFLQTVP